MKDQTAIVGIGWTPFTRESGVSVGTLAAQASLAAVDDAGLRVEDVDGLVTFFHERNDTLSPRELAEWLGLPVCNFNVIHDGGGSWSPASVLTAAALVHAGICKYVLVYRAFNSNSGGPPRKAEATGPEQFTLPYGLNQAVGTFGLYATAHMAKYGTTSLDFAHLAVTQRKHAILNNKAMMRKPITVEDHQQSRMIVEPFRLLDCCPRTDGAVAVIVTTAERARDLRHEPVFIMGGVGGSVGLGGRAEAPDYWETGGIHAAPRLYEAAGVTPKDVSFAEIYDPFTAMCMIHIEDFGFVPKGEIGPWVHEGRNGLDGDLPVNTHGGLLSEGHVHGLNHILEAVQQLRPEGVVDDLCDGPHTFDRSVCRQVRNPEIALVCGESGGSAILLRKA